GLQAGVGGGRARLGVHGALRDRAGRRRPRHLAGRVPHPRRGGRARGREGARPRARGQDPLAGGAALPERPAGGEGEEGHLPARPLPERGGGRVVSAPAFSVWVTGPEQGAVEAIAEELARRLAARRLVVEVLDRRTPGIDALAGEGLERRAAFVAGLLARHGVAVVVALPVAARAARERVRAELGRMIEVHEPPERPEVEIAVPEPSPGAGVEQALRTLELLDLLPRGEDRAYSEEEEREVIRRLKAFGYL